MLPAIIAVLSAGCAMMPQDPPPFVVTKPICRINEQSYEFTYAALSFGILNNGQEAIKQITVSFSLFDSKTQDNPFIGSNVFEIVKQETVQPGENKEILISLDKYIYTAPAEPYLIDFFYISKITYTNGSVSQDKYGTYSTRTLINSRTFK